jgi:hypothetical protein
LKLLLWWLADGRGLIKLANELNEQFGDLCLDGSPMSKYRDPLSIDKIAMKNRFHWQDSVTIGKLLRVKDLEINLVHVRQIFFEIISSHADGKDSFFDGISNLPG